MRGVRALMRWCGVGLCLGRYAFVGALFAEWLRRVYPQCYHPPSPRGHAPTQAKKFSIGVALWFGACILALGIVLTFLLFMIERRAARDAERDLIWPHLPDWCRKSCMVWWALLSLFRKVSRLVHMYRSIGFFCVSELFDIVWKSFTPRSKRPSDPRVRTPS